ncbi:MAG: hypothetical protein HY689_04715 [Chloroflexi bacterium]|nr:hypothetical protein [Chloroflexota bacterium]
MSKRARCAMGVVAVVLLGLLVAASPPGQAARKSVFFLLQVFPDAPVHPLAWTTAPPLQERVSFPHRQRQIAADIFRPPHGVYPGVVVVLGFNVDLADPTLNRTLDALARVGLVVMVPYADVVSGQFDPSEPEVFADAFRYLRAQPFVTDGRVGFLGFSVGSSLAAIAAADPGIRQDVAFLHWFGGYYHAPDLLLAIITHEVLVNGQVVPWTPSAHVVQLVRQAVIGFVDDPGDRQILEGVFLAGQPTTPERLAALSPAGRSVYDLLAASTPEDARRALAQFPEDVQGDLVRLSPSAHVAGITATTFVLHDTGDQFVPYWESRRFWAQLPPESRGGYTEVELFEHMTPQRTEEIGIFVREVVKLYGHLYRLLLLLQ